jgi:hypothetical protein
MHPEVIAVDCAVAERPLELVTTNDGVPILISTIPPGFAVVDNDVFEGKKIVATKPFQKDDVLYIGHALLLDLSASGNKFIVQINSEDGQFLSQHFMTTTHSVDDHAPSSKIGSESKRQVYGFDGFMNHSCDANAYFRK